MYIYIIKAADQSRIHRHRYAESHLRSRTHTFVHLQNIMTSQNYTADKLNSPAYWINENNNDNNKNTTHKSMGIPNSFCFSHSSSFFTQNYVHISNHTAFITRFSYLRRHSSEYFGFVASHTIYCIRLCSLLHSSWSGFFFFVLFQLLAVCLTATWSLLNEHIRLHIPIAF